MSIIICNLSVNLVHLVLPLSSHSNTPRKGVFLLLCFFIDHILRFLFIYLQRKKQGGRKRRRALCDSLLLVCSAEQKLCISLHLLSHLSACYHPMEDSMDMDMSPLRPQNYLFGCELKADKNYFKVDNDENEHLLSLRTVSLRDGAKDGLHIVEAEAMNYEGSPIKVTLTTLKMSVQPRVSLGGFEITPPVVSQLKCGSGPVHINGQHLVAVE